MKRNVDLTENRIFSVNRNPNNSIADVFDTLILESITRGKYPWDKISLLIHYDDDLDLVHQKNVIIAVGNKTTRAEVEKYRQMDSLDYCDCCGERMNLKPWDREIGTCHKCDSRFEREQPKYKW